MEGWRVGVLDLWIGGLIGLVGTCRISDPSFITPSLHCSLPPVSNLVEPEVVATSPNRFKRPVPVCCGFGSVHALLDFKFQIFKFETRRWCSRQDSHLHWRRSRRRVSAVWTTRATKDGLLD